MTDSMTSVADIPGDADDDLSEITPELVLVDPELARIVRERQPAPRAATAPPLRLLPAADETEEPIVPRPLGADEETPRPQSDVVPPPAPAAVATTVGETANGRPPDVFPTPASPTYELPDLGEPAALVPAPQRVVEAEPARVIAPPAVSAAVPPPTHDAFTAMSLAPPAAESQLLSPPAAAVAMPHPIARPERARRPVRTGERRRRRGRGVLAFIAAVAVASVATLGILNLAGGSPSSSAPTVKAPISGGPSSAGGQAAKQAKSGATAGPASKPGTAKTPQAHPKAKTAVKTKKEPTAPKPKVAVKPTSPAKPKPSATSKQTPKATSGTTRSNAKPPVTKQSKPKATPAAPKPATAAPATEARRFAWAPVDGALSYHVELFRGADRVLAKETTQPILELGPSWRYDGKTVQLTPGTYRWYVWPVTKAGRATQAVVQARLDIP
jgi:hypothetical protein